jgi:hypothetical protein
MAGEAIAAAAREADPLPDRSRAAQFISDVMKERNAALA